MLNDQTIQMIAQAIIANTKVLQTLVETLPREAVAKVEEKVASVAPAAPVAPAPAPVVQAAPLPVATPPAPVAAPVVAAPVAPATVSPSNQMPVMPALPVFEAPAPAPAPAPAAPVAVPFKDNQELTQYVLNVYRELGPQKGMQIQKVLDSLGIKNINDTRPDQYAQFYAGVEQIRAAG
jgi:hypothetical protein